MKESLVRANDNMDHLGIEGPLVRANDIGYKITCRPHVVGKGGEGYEGNSYDIWSYKGVD